MPDRLQRALLTLVVLACAAYVVSTVPGVRPTPGHSRFWEIGVYNLVVFGSAALIMLRAMTVPRYRIPWALIGLGLTSYALGTLYFSIHLQPMEEMPYPSLSDGLWLGFYLVGAAGVLLLAAQELRAREASGPRPATALDGLGAGLALASVAAGLAFDRITAGSSGPIEAVITNFAYPVGDLVLLILVAGVLVVLGRSAGSSWWLLGAGFVAFAAADSWFLLQIAADEYSAGSPVDATWAVAETLLAVAAWRLPRDRASTPTHPLMMVLTTALSGATAVAVLVAGNLTEVSLLGVMLATSALFVVSLRMVQALHQAMSLQETRRQARTDELTGLANRRAFYELLQETGGGEPAGTACVLLLDLDRFKEVNDALGHRTGDDLLRVVSERIRRAVAQEHALARLGGDEFAVLVSGPVSVGRALATELLAAIREPYDIGAMTLHLDGSIGIAELEHDTDHGRTLARADVAMYRAKSERTGVHIYSDETDGDSWDRLSTLESLRAGIRDHQLVLEYQPVVSAATREPLSLEALVRWRHPTRGLVAPDRFLPLAERAGLMHEVTSAVLESALSHAAALRQHRLDVPVAVNFSASDLLDSSIVDVVVEGLRRHGLPPSALRIEITETLLVGDHAQSGTVLERLRGMGVLLSVDDYGTGYSSLAYLHDLPVSQLKIDRIFTERLLTDDRTATIVRSTTALAHELGLTVVGEGVEQAAQLEWLAAAGVDAVQGWHVSRPMSAEASIRWLVNAPAASPVSG